MERYYCDDLPGSAGGDCLLGPDDARHLAKVRRVEVGDSVELFDGRGRSTFAVVVEIRKQSVVLRSTRPAQVDPPPRRSIVVATAMPKGERLDWLVEKATEVGVRRLVPLLTDRSTVDPRSGKLDRLRRIVVEACKQSRRNTLMEIDAPTRWDDWLGRAVPASTGRFIAHPGGEPASVAWAGGEVDAGSVVEVAIGPEGGWTDREVDRGVRAGWRLVSLGSGILRIETAAIAAPAILNAAP